MNTKMKFARLVIAATFGSLLWAGCAGPRTHYVDASGEAQPVNLTRFRADTHPEWRTGLDNIHETRTVLDVPDSTLIEAAGAERYR